MTPTTTILLSLSIDAIMAEVQALSALHAYLSPDSLPMPPVLTAAHSDTLKTVVRGAFLRVTLDALPLVGNIHPGESTDTTMPISINISAAAATDTGLPSRLRQAVERAVASATLVACYAGSSAADEWQAMFSRDMATLCAIVPQPLAPGITPCS